MATPYVISSDLVSAYPAKSLEIAQYIDGQVPLLAMTQNAQTGTTYSFVAADFTKLVTLSNASPVAVELPLEATVPWSTGTQLRLLNQGAGTVTVAGAVGVTINCTPLTLTQYKGANLIKTGTDTWTFIPFASGVGAAVYSDANTGTYTGYAYKTYTDSGTLTVTQAGLADILLVAGGGPGGSGSFYGAGGGGGGGVLELTGVYLEVGTYTVTIGGGGAAGSLQGSPTFFGEFYAVGGGLGGAYDTTRGNLGGYTHPASMAVQAVAATLTPTRPVTPGLVYRGRDSLEAPEYSAPPTPVRVQAEAVARAPSATTGPALSGAMVAQGRRRRSRARAKRLAAVAGDTARPRAAAVQVAAVLQ